jgi:hypothetical protein
MKAISIKQLPLDILYFADREPTQFRAGTFFR